MGKYKIRINDVFAPLWHSDCYIYIVTGGRGSGKSYAVGDFIENLSFQQGHKILFTRYTLDSASDSIIPEFVQKIEAEGHQRFFKTGQKDIINTISNSEILFRGIKTSSGNQTAKLKSIEGLTTWVLEEAEELPDLATFNKIKQSIRQKGIQNRIILVLNPRDINHWIYKEFYERAGVPPGFNGEKDNVCYIHTTYLDNIENLSDEFITEAEKCKRYTPNLYAYEYLGEWVLNLEEAIFKLTHIKRYTTLNQEGVRLCYIDTADEGKDHFAAVFGILNGSNFYVIDAIFNLNNLTVNEPVCKERFERHEVDRVYCESNSFGAYFIRNLRAQNPSVPIVAHRSQANKIGRILAQSGYVLEFFHFPVQPHDELNRFMKQMSIVTPESKDQDDAADCVAGIAERIRRDYKKS